MIENSIPVKKIGNFNYDPNSQPLGRGAFGSVYKAWEDTTKAIVAVKVIPSSKLLKSDEQSNMFVREIEVLRQVPGEHIVRLLDVKRTSNNLYIFTDFCDGGDLEGLLRKRYPFSEDQACAIIKQIAEAFVTVEDAYIVNDKGQKVALMHRDIKAANILFHQGKVKVADFGFAKFIDDTSKNTKQVNTILGTPMYMPPQILNDEPYSSKCDIWSTGVLFYEILFRSFPWEGHSLPSLYKNVKNKSLKFPKKINKSTKELIKKMLKSKEEDRFSWKEVYMHPALNRPELRLCTFHTELSVGTQNNI